ncbi:MAG: M48 family metallopeptidase [Mariprofundaceae bacterium]|nr:M48 family metallopeptidase [Mariprofundaceae bacterium]
MNYSNPLPPEGINTSKDISPLAEAAVLSVSLVLILACVLGLIHVTVSHVTKFISLSQENQLFRQIPFMDESTQNTQSKKVESYLQTLVNDLAQQQQIPKEATITVHYSDSAIINAGATLGGHIIVFRGLLERIPDENTLAMVLGHEVSHVLQRHPIQSLSQGLTLVVLTTALSTYLSDGLANQLFSTTNLIGMMAFSREKEHQADLDAVRSLAQYYGHIGGSTELFDILQKVSPDQSSDFFQTHPLNQSRQHDIAQLAIEKAWRMDGTRTPLPQYILDLKK